MKDDKIKVINSNFIQTYNAKVTEEINPKYQLQFIKASLKNSELIIDDNSTIFYSYLKDSLSYEILCFNTDSNTQTILEPLILKAYYKEKTKSTDLFILNDSFVLYQNSEFLLFKHLNHIDQNDIKIYLSQKYNINIDNTYSINNDDLEEMKKSYIKNSFNHDKKRYKKYKSTNSFLYFILFTLLCFMIFLYTIFNHNSKTLKPKQTVNSNYTHKLNIYKKHNKDLIEDTITLFKHLKINKITIKSLEYSNNRINLEIFHTNKDRLFDFTTTYNKQIKINSLWFMEETKQYKMEISIEY
ncbi:MAG: hypothetical protein U9O56_07275 [Campylobacterota bacterium]|nr:hypothetical protein [Campylobacterota bacterium]